MGEATNESATPIKAASVGMNMPRPELPHGLYDFIRRFPDDEACWRYLVQSRWPDGFRCPDGKSGSFIKTRKLFRCQNGHEWSATVKTVMHRTKIPLCKWFWAAYLVTTHTPGMSALQFARQLGLRYETAYMMLQKLRAGMVNPKREKLRGIVEVDESYIGGKQAGPGGRGARGKALIVGGVEVVGEHAGRVRLRKIPNASASQLLGFIRDQIEPGSTIVTDQWQGYAQVGNIGYRHKTVTGDSRVQVTKGLPHIHRVFGNLKAWLIGTHHGVSPKHLQAYLNEYTFRFNRRKTPMAAFQTVLGIGSNVRGPTYKGVYRGAWIHPNPLGSSVSTG